MAEIIETRAGTMVDNDSNKRRRLFEFKDGCRYGKFGKTKAYELIAALRFVGISVDAGRALLASVEVPIQKADKEKPREIIVATVPAPASSPTRLVAAKSRRRPRRRAGRKRPSAVA
jgi:hypothetical protein